MPNSIPAAQLTAVMADIGDGGGILSDAILDVLEATPVFPNSEDGFLSLNALTGVPKQNAVQLREPVDNQVMLILVDSGSFIPSSKSIWWIGLLPLGLLLVH